MRGYVEPLVRDWRTTSSPVIRIYAGDEFDGCGCLTALNWNGEILFRATCFAHRERTPASPGNSPTAAPALGEAGDVSNNDKE